MIALGELTVSLEKKKVCHRLALFFTCDLSYVTNLSIPSPFKNCFMSKNSKVLLGFIAGVAAGVGIYALLQSEEGQKWIQTAKDTAGKWKEEIDDLLKKGKEMAGDAAEAAADEAS
jgi:hypothetical protein